MKTSPHRHPTVALPLIATLWLLHAAPVRAAPSAAPGPSTADKQHARRLFEAGKRHFHAGRYRQAARAFAQAHHHRPHRVLLRNIALAHAQRGDTEAAATYLRRYLAQATEADPPLPPILRHVRRAFSAPPRTTPPVRRASPTPGTTWRRLQRLHWAYFAGAAGATVALIVSATATSVQTLRVHQEYAADPSDLALRSRGLRLQRATNGLWASAAVAAVATATLAFFTRWRRPERSERLSAQVLAGPGHGGLRLRLRY